MVTQVLRRGAPEWPLTVLATQGEVRSVQRECFQMVTQVLRRGASKWPLKVLATQGEVR